MSIVNQSEAPVDLNPLFVGRTQRDLTAGSNNDQPFASEDILDGLPIGVENVFLPVTGIGSTFNLGGIVPKINFVQGWNLVAYTLPYEFDASLMLLGLFKPEFFQPHPVIGSLLADRLITGGPNGGPLDANTPILEGVLGEAIKTSAPDLVSNLEIGTDLFDFLFNEGLQIAKDDDGNVLFAEHKFNGLGNFKPGRGYQIKNTISIGNKGFFEIDALNQDITSVNDYLTTQDNLVRDLRSGFSFIGYNRITQGLDVRTFFQNFFGVTTDQEVFNSGVIIVKDRNGDVYMPDFSFNGIGNFIPGQGYQIKTNDGISNFKFPSDGILDDDKPLIDLIRIIDIEEPNP